MKFEMDISDDELKDAVIKVIASRYYSDYTSDRRHVDKIVSEAVRSIIYKDKERITDLIVTQASRECGNKAIKKIIESITEGK